MGELGFNKFFGAALATFLLIFGLNEVSARMFGEGGHHGDHHYDSLNDWAEAKFHGYRIHIPETSSGGADAEEEPPLDLGLLLANADVAAGEAILTSECAACHQWHDGGVNGTGPNLYGVIGRDVAAVEGFRYSRALTDIDGNWTYEQMNDWLASPSSFARGTTMSYAGLRSPRRDKDRINVIAYLASASPGAPAFPDPLPAAVVEEGDASGPIDGDVTDAGGLVENAEAAAATVTDAVEGAAEAATDLTDGAVVEAAEEAGSNLLEQATDAAEEIVDEATDGEH